MVSVSVVMPNTSTTYVHLKIPDVMFCMYVGPIPYIVKSRWNAFTTIVRNQRCNISFGNSVWQHAYYSTDSSGTLSRDVLMYENIHTLAVACKALQWSAHQHCQRRVNNSVIQKNPTFFCSFSAATVAERAQSCMTVGMCTSGETEQPWRGAVHDQADIPCPAGQTMHMQLR